MKKFLLFALFLFFSSFLFSQNLLPVKGLINDERTKNAIEGATIYNPATKEAVLTNEQGHFKLYTPALATDTIIISAISYETQWWRIVDLLKATGTISLKRKEIQLSEVVVAAVPNEQYKIISKIDINLRGINNSQEVLRMIPGLFIGQHAGGGKAEQIFLRGFDIDHGTDISLSVDGMPVNMVSHAHGQGYADLHFLIPELIDRVDFKKGTYYPQKGNFTTSGYVDFKTLQTLENSSIKMEGGMFNTFRTVGMFDVLNKKAKKDGQSLFIASECMHTRGYFDDPQNFKRLNVFAKYHGNINANNVLNVSTSYFDSRWNASGQIPDRAVADGTIGYFGAIDPNEGGETSRANANMQLLTNLRKGHVLKNQVYYSAYDFLLFSNFTFFKNDPLNGDQIKQQEHRNLFGYNGSYTTTTYAGKTGITSEVGANLRFDKTKNSELSRTINRLRTAEQLMLGDIDESNIAAYINETFKFNQQFSLSTGLRYDYFLNRYQDRLNNNAIGKANAGIFSPKLNLHYTINQKTQFYFSAGKGFHSNDTRVAVPQDGLRVLPSALGADLGSVFKPSKNIFINTALWYLWMEQEFVYVGDEGIVEPSGKSRRLGMDISARYQPMPWLYLDVDLNYSRPRSLDQPKGENYLPLAPVFTSIGGATVKTKKGINGSLRYRYMGDRPANEDYSLTAKGYLVTDALVNYTNKKFEFGISAQNLFNVKWKETQFETESRLMNEAGPVSEIHFTPGTPFFLKASFTYIL